MNELQTMIQATVCSVRPWRRGCVARPRITSFSDTVHIDSKPQTP